MHGFTARFRGKVEPPDAGRETIPMLEAITMRTPPPVRSLSVLLVALTLVAGTAAFAQQAQPFKPEVGQGGKDVVWVPTPQALVDKMLDMANVTPQDVVMDLGSGDGITVITAAKRGARAIGIEYNPDMVELSKANAEKAGVSDKATFMKADLFETDLSQATVITMFLLPQINMQLRPKLLDLKPGTRIVSNSFSMEDWVADETATVTEGCQSWCTALFWIVPAKVEGRWQTEGGELTFVQTFQQVSGTLQKNGTSAAITDGRLRGAALSMTIDGAQYAGRVNGNTIEGTVTTSGKTLPWKATR
jgi:precorrin-6B methylase 2